MYMVLSSISIGTVSTPSLRGNSRKCTRPVKSCLSCSHRHGPLPMTQPDSTTHMPRPITRRHLFMPTPIAQVCAECRVLPNSCNASLPVARPDVAGILIGCYTRVTNQEACPLGSKLAQSLPARRTGGYRPGRVSFAQGCD